MKRYLLLFTAPTEVREKMQSASPEEMKAAMQPWMDWFAKVGEKMVDKGMPLANAMTVTKEGVMPGNVEFVGYDVVQAENIDEAMDIAKESPHLDRGEGTTVEVHEMMDMPGLN